MNAKNWAVRAASHITWALLTELPSHVFSAESMLAWDQAAVAAAMAQPHEQLGSNLTAVTHSGVHIPAACIEDQEFAAPTAVKIVSSAPLIS